jgi:uncharacterized protein (UPF0212 family)
MANLTLPNPEVPVGKMKCPHCGQEHEVKIDPIWFRKLQELLKLINDSL